MPLLSWFPSGDFAAAAPFDLFGGMEASMVALPRRPCPCRVALLASSEVDKAAKRRARQRWPGAIELGDAAKPSDQDVGKVARASKKAAVAAVASGGSPRIDLSWRNSAGPAVPRASFFHQLPGVFKATREVFGPVRSEWSAENAAGMENKDVAVRRAPWGPSRTGSRRWLARRPRPRWLSRQPREKAGVCQIEERELRREVKVTVDSALFPTWAEDGWSPLGPATALPIFAELSGRASLPAPAVGIETISAAAIGRRGGAS